MFTVRSLVQYASVNTFVLPINIGIAWLLTEMGMHYLLATIVGYAVHVTLAFAINHAWTFRHRTVMFRPALFRAYAVHTSSFVLVLFITALLVECGCLTFFYARVAASVCAGIWDFVFDSLVTFAEHTSEE